MVLYVYFSLALQKQKNCEQKNYKSKSKEEIIMYVSNYALRYCVICTLQKGIKKFKHCILKLYHIWFSEEAYLSGGIGD